MSSKKCLLENLPAKRFSRAFTDPRRKSKDADFHGCRYVRDNETVLRMYKSQIALGRCNMKKTFVISAATLIAIGAAIFSWTEANAEDARGGGVNIIRLAPVPPNDAMSKAPRRPHRHSVVGRSIYVNGAHMKCSPPR